MPRPRTSPLAADAEAMPTLIGIPAAAQMSGVSVRTLRRLIARGELPCFRAGSARVLKVRPRDVAALFERV